MHEHHLVGEYEEMGRQYGRQLDEHGRSLDAASPETLDPPQERRTFSRECVRHIEDHAPFLLDELKGIAAETGNDPKLVETVPLALDALSGCSLVAIPGEYTSDGSVLFGRNHDFHPSFRTFATLYRTEPKDSLASVGCSCVFVGRCDGINEAGLAIGFAGVPPHEFEPGMMWQLAIRAVLDTCRTTDDAVSFLESIPHTTNVNFLVVDITGEIVLVEASPECVMTTRTDDGLVSVTNQFHTEFMREFQSTDRLPSDCSRLQSVKAWFDSQKQQITCEDLQVAMGDPEKGMCWSVDEENDDPRSTIWSWTMNPTDCIGYLAEDSPVGTPYEPVHVAH